MNSKLNALVKNSSELSKVYTPSFYRLNNSSDQQEFEKLLQDNPQIFVYDEILGQVEELVKSRNPKTVFSKEALTEAAKGFLSNTSWEEYGVWVYYPWSKRLVHMLDELEFLEVRTNRNRYKISPEEYNVLATKKIGVIGLSVGQSVATTIALERTCGELRIADYDILELSNLNRIRTGIHNLGLQKTVNVAREIAEFDPFLKVTCFHEGINENNISEFLLDGGKLDLLIDECDGLDIKILCRQKAKELTIPVVMEASDRGTIDVERFDLEPSRSILHGYIDHLDISKVKNLKTNEEKIPYLLPIAGAETISCRAKASMIEVGQTITTWPQLASAVAFGGGLTADVCRRILLDQFHESGRYFVDVEELVRDKTTTIDEVKPSKRDKAPAENFFRDAIMETISEFQDGQVKLERSVVKDLVSAAILAPSGGNAQPWTWKYFEGNLYLFLDNGYVPKLIDFQRSSSCVGMGAASENLVLKAHELGLEVKVKNFPLKNNPKLIAVFSFFKKGTSLKEEVLEHHGVDHLSHFIPERRTNRKIVSRKPLPASALSELCDIAKTVRGAELKFIYDEKSLNDLGAIIAKADRIRIMHKGGHDDFSAEMRFTHEEAVRKKNGLDLDLIDLTASERAGFSLARDWKVIQYLNEWKGGGAFEKYARKITDSASAIGLLTMPGTSPLEFYNGGRAIQRIWLLATEKNIAFQPLTIITTIFHTFLNENKNFFPEEMSKELDLLRSEFVRIFSIDKRVGEIMLFRVFEAEPPEKRSLRIPTEEILSFIDELK